MGAKVITYINEKGGVGKTSVCYNTAWELARQGKKILMIDVCNYLCSHAFSFPILYLSYIYLVSILLLYCITHIFENQLYLVFILYLHI